jgi:hypothetical protein
MRWKIAQRLASERLSPGAVIDPRRALIPLYPYI